MNTPTPGWQFLSDEVVANEAYRVRGIEVLSALRMSANRSEDEGFHNVAFRLRADADHIEAAIRHASRNNQRSIIFIVEV